MEDLFLILVPAAIGMGIISVLWIAAKPFVAIFREIWGKNGD